MSRSLLLLALLTALFCPSPLWAAPLSSDLPAYSLSGGDDGGAGALFRFFQRRFSPEEMTLVVDGQPDESGKIRHLFLDVRGARVDGMRLDHIAVEALDVRFNDPEEWEEDLVVEAMLAVYSQATIREEDLNARLREKQIGDDDENWQRIGVDFRREGVHAEGVYRARLLFTFDILIEIDGQFDLVRGRQIWLSDYTLKVNRRQIPESLAKRAVSSSSPFSTSTASSSPCAWPPSTRTTNR